MLHRTISQNIVMGDCPLFYFQLYCMKLEHADVVALCLDIFNMTTVILPPRQNSVGSISSDEAKTQPTGSQESTTKPERVEVQTYKHERGMGYVSSSLDAGETGGGGVARPVLLSVWCLLDLLSAKIGVVQMCGCIYRVCLWWL